MYNNHLFSILLLSHGKLFIIILSWSLPMLSVKWVQPYIHLDANHSKSGQRDNIQRLSLFLHPFSFLSNICRIKKPLDTFTRTLPVTHTPITLSFAVPPTIKINTHTSSNFMGYCMAWLSVNTTLEETSYPVSFSWGCQMNIFQQSTLSNLENWTK